MPLQIHKFFNAAEGGVKHEFSIYVTGKSSHITLFPFPLYM